jgi:chemotaxis protein MotB
MARLTSNLVKLMSVALVLVAFGCTDQLKQCKTDLAAAQDQVKQLKDQCDKAERAREVAEAEAAALKAERDRLKADLAKAAAPAPGWNNAPGGAFISVEEAVLFESGKADLLKEGMPTLDKIAATIKSKFPRYEIYVVGHTDTEPIVKSGWKDNYELSAQRALTVLRYLKGTGLGNPMAAEGWGETRPVATNETKEGRQANRRVEVFALDPKSRVIKR